MKTKIDNEYCIDKLIGAIARSALQDYYIDVETLVEKRRQYYLRKNKGKPLSEYQKQVLNNYEGKLNYDKASAVMFFTKSKLFKLTNLNFEYLKMKKDYVLNADLEDY